MDHLTSTDLLLFLFFLHRHEQLSHLLHLFRELLIFFHQLKHTVLVCRCRHALALELHELLACFATVDTGAVWRSFAVLALEELVLRFAAEVRRDLGGRVWFLRTRLNGLVALDIAAVLVVEELVGV